MLVGGPCASEFGLCGAITIEANQSSFYRAPGWGIQDPPQAQLFQTYPAVRAQLWRFRVMSRTKVVQLTERPAG